MIKNRGIIIVFAVFLLSLTQGLLAVQYAVVSESFSVSPGGTLTVDVAGADINIRGEQGSVTVNVKGLKDEYRQWLEISQAAGGVLVKFDPKKRIRGDDALVFEIGVPREFSIKADTTGGDITILSEIMGNVSADTSGGDISIQEKVTGLLEGETSGGDISVADVEGPVTVSTSGGDIEVGNVVGDVDAQTSGGDIEIQNVRGRLEARTSGGDIEVENVSGDASVKTAGGDLDIGTVDGALEAHTAGGDITVTEVKGKTDAETAGGDVTLKKLGGDFGASTVGGDVVVGLAGSYPGEMSTIGGDLVLMLPASARVSIEAEIKLSGNDEGDESPITSEFGAIEINRGSIIKTVSASFDINGGGPVIEMQNLSGTIAVKKLP